MAPGTRFLVEDTAFAAREGCDDLEDIKCMKQVGPVELVAQAKGKYEIQKSNYNFFNYWCFSRIFSKFCSGELVQGQLQKHLLDL